MRPRAALALGLGLLATACALPADPSMQLRVVGIVDWPQAGEAIEASLGFDPAPYEPLSAPDTVTVNVPFEVRVTTIGLSGCWRAAGGDVEAEPLRVLITPHDFVTSEPDGRPTYCTGALVHLPRSVPVRYTERGEATLILNGRRVLGGDPRHTESVTIEKRIIVR
jgi:hypothetical protein